MLRARQIQAVADRVAAGPEGREGPSGRRAVVADRRTLESMDEPWKGLLARVEPVDDWRFVGRVLWAALVEMEWGDREEKERVIQLVKERLPERRHPYPDLGTLAEGLEPVGWLWPGWIPRGMLSLLGAAPGAGKSLVALDLARRIVSGDRFPDQAVSRRRSKTGACVDDAPGQQFPKAGNCALSFRAGPVIYVDAEAVPQLQNERARAWGMDVTRLFLMLPGDEYGMLDLGREEDQDLLVDMCGAIGPELVVVDSLGSVSVRGENNVEDVRSLLGFLSAVAREFDVGMLLIHHLRKRGKGLGPATVGPDEFRGSSHIVAMARSVLALSVVQTGPKVDRNGPRRLEVVKTNLCRYPPALGAIFEERTSCHELHELHEGKVPWVRYREAVDEYREPSQAEVCAAWIVEVLEEEGEPVRSKEVYAMAREAGFKKGVVYRARKMLGERVEDTEPTRSPKNCWCLADAG